MISGPSIFRILRLMVVMAVVGLATESFAAVDAPSWRVREGDVRVVCPLTVGGSFEAKTSVLEGNVTERSSRPAILVGSVSVDLKSLDTGIGLRNDHMRNVYLEVDKGEGFDKAVLSDIHLGDVDWETFEGQTSFTGTFFLHGTKKTITGRAEIRKQGSMVRIKAGFPLSIADFGIAKPQYLGIGVKNEVQAKVNLVLSPDLPTGASR